MFPERFGYYFSMVADLLLTIAVALVRAFAKGPTQLIVWHALMGLGIMVCF